MAQQAQIEIVLSNGAKAGETLKELQQTANRLSKEISNLKPGSEEFTNKAKDFQQVTNKLKGVRDEVKGVSSAQKGMIQEFSKFFPLGGKVAGIASNFKNMTGAVGGTTKGLGGLRAALISTGIGALIVLIGSLVSWLSKTQRGMEFVEKATAAVGAIFDVLRDRAVMVIDGIKSLFSGDVKEGLNTLKNSVKGVGDEMLRETVLAWQLKEAMIQLGKSETDFTLIQAQRKRQIQELLFLSIDEKTSFEERRKALQQANELEQANLEGSLKLQRQKVDLMQQEYDRAESIEDDRAALIAERVKLEDMEAESLAKQRDLRNRLNELDKKESADYQKRQAEKLKLIASEQKAKEDAAKAEAEAQKALMDELLRIEKEGADEIKRQLQEVEEMRKQGQQNQLTELDILNQEKAVMIEQAHLDGFISEEERQEQLFQLEVDRLQKTADLYKKFYGEDSDEYRRAQAALSMFRIQAAKKEIDLATATEEDKIAIRIENAKNSIKAGQWLLGNMQDLYDEESAEFKALAIFQAELSAIEAAINSFTMGSKLGGPVLGAIWAALAFGFGQAQIMKMNAVQKAERGMVVKGSGNAVNYSFGGVLRGPSHAQGGIPIEAEGDEIILTKGVYRDPVGRLMASELNARFGGARFMEAGGPVNPIGVSSVGMSMSPLSDNSEIVRHLERLNGNFVMLSQDVKAWQRNLQVINNVQDTREGINVINKLEYDSGF